jgi:cell volume regulation protein A
MVLTLELVFLGTALLFLISIIANKFSERLGVPALLIFLIVGMLAGSEGPGGIPFDEPAVAQIIGIIALAYILFAGGFDTRWGTRSGPSSGRGSASPRLRASSSGR